MRALLLFCLAVGGACAQPDLSKPIPVLALPDGRVLKNAEFRAYKAEVVLIRSGPRSIAVRYDALPHELRIAAEQRRPGGPRIGAGEMALIDGTEVKGQVFITTAGASSYKFSDVTVYAFPVTASTAWETSVDPVRLPKPISSTNTDADGRFILKVPRGSPFLLFAQAERLRTVGVELVHERFEWRVPSAEIKHLDQVNLSDEWRHSQRKFVISEY